MFFLPCLASTEILLIGEKKNSKQTPKEQGHPQKLSLYFVNLPMNKETHLVHVGRDQPAASFHRSTLPTTLKPPIGTQRNFIIHFCWTTVKGIASARRFFWYIGDASFLIAGLSTLAYMRSWLLVWPNRLLCMWLNPICYIQLNAFLSPEYLSFVCW